MNNDDTRNTYNSGVVRPSYVVNGWNAAGTIANVSSEDAGQDLGRKTADFMAKIRAEAELIIGNAKKQVEQIRLEMLAECQKEREELEKRVTELETARKTLEDDLDAFEKQRATLEKDAFEKAKEEGLRQGLEEGTKRGYAQGMKDAETEIETQVEQRVETLAKKAAESACAPVHRLIREMSEARQTLLKNWEENIMQIAAAIAYQTILREPTILRQASIDLLREALELAMNCTTLKIRMNPDDVENLRDQIDSVREETGNIAKSEVIPDSKITRGGCLVETSLGVVDERLETRLERIVAELSE